jgi:hypothetical protein
MTVLGDISDKGLRYLGRCIMLPHRVVEVLDRVRYIEQSLRPSGISPGEVYAGYSASEVPLFDLFSRARPSQAPGFVTDFLKTRTRSSSLWDAVRTLDGEVMGRPVPHEVFEAIELVGLLKAVVSARGGRFAMMELGAGWGRWLVAGAVASRLRNVSGLRLLAGGVRPVRDNFRFNRSKDSMIQMTDVDGVQVWRNARPVEASGAH